MIGRETLSSGRHGCQETSSDLKVMPYWSAFFSLSFFSFTFFFPLFLTRPHNLLLRAHLCRGLRVLPMAALDHSIECWINGASSPLQTTHKKKRTTTITTTTSVISPGPPPAPNPGPPPPPPPTPVQPSESTAHKIIALLSVVGACLAMLVIVAMVAGQ